MDGRDDPPRSSRRRYQESLYPSAKCHRGATGCLRLGDDGWEDEDVGGTQNVDEAADARRVDLRQGGCECNETCHRSAWL